MSLWICKSRFGGSYIDNATRVVLTQMEVGNGIGNRLWTWVLYTVCMSESTTESMYFIL